jgi:hypothetical protein
VKLSKKQRDRLEEAMGQTDHDVLLLILVAFLAILFFKLFCKRWMLEALIEAINNFRGGPPTPMHPSPAGDDALLRRPSKKVES